MQFGKLWRLPGFVMMAAGVAGAHTSEPFQPVTERAAWTWTFASLWDLPVFSWFAAKPVIEPLVFDLSGIAPDPCLVAPLRPVLDEEARKFEFAAGTGSVVQIDGLTGGTVRALTRLERLVASAGGTLVLTSAYRPAEYQAHLQELWDKWMFELRDNTDPACAPLRAEVRYEFARHQLLESQRPATFSDHTRGLSFDAAVQLPARARYGRKRVNVDTLARMAGVRRPAIASDPVHFRLM